MARVQDPIPTRHSCNNRSFAISRSNDIIKSGEFVRLRILPTSSFSADFLGCNSFRGMLFNNVEGRQEAVRTRKSSK